MSDREKYPSEAAERFQIRLPPGLRDRIRVASEANNRSMNAEIVATLEEAYPVPDPVTLALNQMSDILQRRRLGLTEPGEYESLPEFIRKLVEETEADETPEEREQAIERARIGFSTKVEKTQGGYVLHMPVPIPVRGKTKGDAS